MKNIINIEPLMCVIFITFFRSFVIIIIIFS